ncbi:MAG: peptide-N-glycosidase F-related protein [Chitinophagales bacterium]
MKYLALFLFILFAGCLIAANGDTIHIISHNKQLIQTNPAIGHTEYASWVQFPPASVNYRKVKVTMTYGCPSGMHCGEWDYLNYVWLRRKGGVQQPSMDIQLVKFITPYGYSNPSSWKFSWEMDITDFASLLHDSVEIEYQHTGYEATSGRGWLVKLDFELTEGIPTYVPVAVDTLWHGSYNFGNATHDLETYLAPRNITIHPGSDAQKFYLVQTGHGSDTIDGCCEFANYNQNLLLDNSMAQTWQVWKRCGDNPCYPQSGTWPLDRANWCPGGTVQPYEVWTRYSANSSHTLDLEMQQKSHDLFQQGNYDLRAYLFEYKDNRFDIDATIDKILQPSDQYEQLRINPVSVTPRIILKNSGKQVLRRVKFRYGYEGYYDTDYEWQGLLAPDQKTEVVLPNMPVNHTPLQPQFYVFSFSPNQQCDQYPFDDTMRVGIKVPALYDSVVVLNFKTSTNLPAFNATAADFSYTLKDASGAVLYQRNAGTLAAATVYRDTFHLEEGVYDFYFRNENPDVSYGLGFWLTNNYGQTSGYVRLDRLGGSAYKNFGSDWGQFVHEAIVVGNPSGNPQVLSATCFPAGVKDEKQVALLHVFPNPTAGRIQVEASGMITASTLRDVTGRLVWSGLPAAYGEIDVRGCRSGVYLLQVEVDHQWMTTRVIIEE